MCVAVVIESDTPTLTELQQMESCNPHGAGFAFPTPQGMRYYKGLTAEQLWEVLDRVPRPVLLHFRWATHGPKEARLTHPFPLGERALLDASLVGTAPSVLIHNGVWNEHWRHRPEWAAPLMGYVSDTQIAAYAAEANESILDEVDWATAVAQIHTPDSGSPRCRVTLRGRWFEHNGNMFSNFNWQKGERSSR